MTTEAHKHVFEVPYTEKVRLSKYEVIEGKLTSEGTGHDVLKGWQCKCGLKEATDLERHKL